MKQGILCFFIMYEKSSADRKNNFAKKLEIFFCFL